MAPPQITSSTPGTAASPTPASRTSSGVYSSSAPTPRRQRTPAAPHPAPTGPAGPHPDRPATRHPSPDAPTPSHPMLGKPQRRDGRQQAHQHTRRPHSRMPAPRQHRPGRPHRRHHGDQPRRPCPPQHTRVPVRGPAPLQLVVDESLQRTGAQRPAGPPQHEPHREGAVRRHEHPHSEPGARQQRTKNKQQPTRHRIGPHPGRHLEHHSRDGPQGEQGRDLPHGQPGVAEEQRVHRVQQNEFFEERVAVERGRQPTHAHVDGTRGRESHEAFP